METIKVYNVLDFWYWLRLKYPDMYDYFYRKNDAGNSIYNIIDNIKDPLVINSGTLFKDIALYIEKNEHLHEFWLL